MNEFSPEQNLPVPETDLETISHNLETNFPAEVNAPNRASVKETIKTSFTPADTDQASSPATTSSDSLLPDYTKDDSPETRQAVTELVRLAEAKGIKEAITAAQKTNDPYLLDTLHDALVDKIIPELTRRGVIK